MSQAAVDVVHAPTPTEPLRRNRTFRLLLVGNVISILGDGFHSVALGLWVLQSTGSSMAMSAVVGIRMIIGILLGAVGGAMVDRSNRRLLMWSSDLVRGVLVLAMAGAIALHVHLAVILLLTALVAVVSTLRGPAYTASLVHIVGREHVQQASSLQQMFATGAQISGPLLGGAVAAALGGWAALTVDGLSFFACAACVLLAGAFPSPRRASGPTSMRDDLRTGLIYLRREPFVGGLVALAPFVNFFVTAAGILIPVAAIKVWHTTPTEFGLLEAMIPLGVAVGSGALTFWGQRLRRRGWWIGGIVVAYGPLIGLLGLATSVHLAYPALLVMGVGMAVVSVLLNTALQTQTQPELQGRVFGTLNSLQNVAGPLAVALAGTLADGFGVAPVIVGAGAAVAAVGGVGLAVLRSLRAYD